MPSEAPTIQAGLDSAAFLDSVIVACGTYYEHDLRPPRGIVLTSETGLPDCVTIDAQRQGRVMLCDTNVVQVRITGFTFTGGLAAGPDWHVDRDGGGLVLRHSAGAHVRNCVFTGNEADDKGDC